MMNVSSNGIGVASDFGDMQVVVFMPGNRAQSAYSFQPKSHPEGLKNVSRRDLAVMRAMLQDALDDVDDERRRRITDQAFPLAAPAVPPRPAVGRDPSEGGLGLYLIAELATDHGWYVTDGVKYVWALLPRG